MDWRELSEVCAGLILDGHLSINGARPDLFAPPYDDILKAIKADKTTAWIEQSLKINVTATQTALTAGKAVMELGKVDWLQQLHEAYVMYEVADHLQKASNDLKRGRKIDVGRTVQRLSQLSTGRGAFTPMSQVEAKPLVLRRSGMKWLDKHVGGLPETGVVTIGAAPKTGKTTLLMNLTPAFLRAHPGKNVAIFTREMLEEHYKYRAMQVEPDLTAQEMDRILLCHDVKDIIELATKASTLDNVGLVGVDFADLLIQGNVDPGKMEEVYRVLAELANTLKCPIVLLAQFSRGYQGGVPRPYHLRWTGMAEALSSMILTLYAPDRDWHADKATEVPIVPGHGYVFCWASRAHTKADLPGAIQIPWLGENGWSKNAGKWFTLQTGKQKSEEDEDKEDPLDNNQDWT